MQLPKTARDDPNARLHLVTTPIFPATPHRTRKAKRIDSQVRLRIHPVLVTLDGKAVVWQDDEGTLYRPITMEEWDEMTVYGPRKPEKAPEPEPEPEPEFLYV